MFLCIFETGFCCLTIATPPPPPPPNWHADLFQFCRFVLLIVGIGPLLSGWLILYQGRGVGGGGSEGGWVGLSGFPPVLGKVQVSVFLGGWVGC